MSEQMFSPQENEPQGPEERQANTDPREQGAGYQHPPEWDSSAYSSYDQGYRGYDMHTEGEKLRPPQSIVSGRSDLVVDNPFGAIRIHRGSVNSVEVRGTRYYSSLFPGRPSYPLNATQQENQVRVEVWSPQARRSFSLGDFGRIDLDIFTPESSDVHIRSDASTIAVDGIQGHAYIRTNAGTIDVKNASLAGQSFVHTNAGTINVQNVKLEGNTRMETNAGTISFSGSVNPGGYYSFETNAGTIDMALPAGTAFVLDAKTDLGTVSNQFGNMSVGEGPRATLHLHTHLGTISVKPRW